MAKLPPTPVGVPPGHSFWNDWYEKLRDLVNNSGIITTFSSLDFTGSNLTSIATRNHNDLQGLTTGDPHTQYQQESEKNTASGYAGLNTVSRTTKGVDTTDDVIIDLATKGLVLKDTQGTPHYWRVTVSTLGVLTTTDLGTTKP